MAPNQKKIYIPKKIKNKCSYLSKIRREHLSAVPAGSCEVPTQNSTTSREFVLAFKQAIDIKPTKSREHTHFSSSESRGTSLSGYAAAATAECYLAAGAGWGRRDRLLLPPRYNLQRASRLSGCIKIQIKCNPIRPSVVISNVHRPDMCPLLLRVCVWRAILWVTHIARCMQPEKLWLIKCGQERRKGYCKRG